MDAFKALLVIRLYQKASNAKVTTKKTVVIKVGQPDFYPPKGMAPIQPKEYFRHLGIHFTPTGLAQDIMKANLLSFLHQKTQTWKHLRLCLVGKVVALYVLIYLKLWYTAHITPITWQA